jgi:cell wall-associated NlpC family hydrolase
VKPYLSQLLSILVLSTCFTAPQAAAQVQIWNYPLVLSPRQILVYQAKEVADKYGHLPYKFGSSNPKSGGFDCSGAMYYVMRRCGYKPPRTSAQQYIWIRDNAKIHKVGKKVESFDDPAFKHLRVGDLLFWSGTYTPIDGRKVKISHVGIYLGKEADGRRIMACASEGRSYRGKKGDGYGIYDFRLPRKTSKSTFVGYGSLPGMW